MRSVVPALGAQRLVGARSGHPVRGRHRPDRPVSGGVPAHGTGARPGCGRPDRRHDRAGRPGGNPFGGWLADRLCPGTALIIGMSTAGAGALGLAAVGTPGAGVCGGGGFPVRGRHRLAGRRGRPAGPSPVAEPWGARHVLSPQEERAARSRANAAAVAQAAVGLRHLAAGVMGTSRRRVACCWAQAMSHRLARAAAIADVLLPHAATPAGRSDSGPETPFAAVERR